MAPGGISERKQKRGLQLLCLTLLRDHKAGQGASVYYGSISDHDHETKDTTKIPAYGNLFCFVFDDIKVLNLLGIDSRPPAWFWSMLSVTILAYEITRLLI